MRGAFVFFLELLVSVAYRVSKFACGAFFCLMLKKLRSLGEFRSVLLIILLAFALRVVVIPFLLSDITNSAKDQWDFGWEEGRIARSIATGQGFSSPHFGNIGPTAWTTPVCPCDLSDRKLGYTNGYNLVLSRQNAQRLFAGGTAARK